MMIRGLTVSWISIQAAAARLALVVVVAGVVSSRQTDGLTIYRIGGQDLDPPEQCGERNVDCVQLAFEEVVDESRFGRLEQLETNGGVLAARAPGPCGQPDAARAQP